MKIKVKLNNLRIAPRKTRQVIDLIRGKKAAEAQSILSFTVNKSARPVLKLLNSAIASAKHDFQIDEPNLLVSEIFVDEGPKLKRWHPMSRGRAYPIIKRTSRITLILSEIEPNLLGEAKEKVKKPKISLASPRRKPRRKTKAMPAGRQAKKHGA